MSQDYATLSSIPLASGARVTHPAELPELVHMDSPASDVMTDFERIVPLTVGPDTSIASALSRMKVAGVRLLLVTDTEGTVVGLITAKDIQGDKPVRIAREQRLSHAQIPVEAVMTAQASITVLNLLSVRNAQVGHVVRTLSEAKRQHALVVEVDEQSHTQAIRGMFSTSQIGKQLGYEVGEDVPPAQSLADLHQEIG